MRIFLKIGANGVKVAIVANLHAVDCFSFAVNTGRQLIAASALSHWLILF
jgi:hypothetical protein